MSLIKEFKEFAMRGNVIDLAVGVVIGAAFGKIVTSLVNEVIMPPIGLVTGGVDFSQLKWVLKPADPVNKVAEVALQYGAFINTIIQFVIIAFAIFLVVKLINKLSRKQEAAPAAATAEVALLTEIRDLLKNRPS
jgi:large conductance mechanosensitive channel